MVEILCFLGIGVVLIVGVVLVVGALGSGAVDNPWIATAISPAFPSSWSSGVAWVVDAVVEGRR